MKRNSLFLAMVLVGIPSVSLSTAPLDWAKTRYQQARDTVSSYYHLAKNNAACLRAGTCPQIARRLKLMGAAVAASAALLAGAGAVAYALEPEEDEPIEIIVQEGSGVQVVDIGSVLKKWRIAIPEGESITALFIKAVSSGDLQMTEQQADLVKKDVLQAGKEIAELRSKSSYDIYAPIQSFIQEKIATFNADALRKRLGFLYAVTTGLAQEVQETVCYVGQDTIEEAKIQLGKKVGYAFDDIRGLLNNPPCE